jgi:hypothetical protein
MSIESLQTIQIVLFFIIGTCVGVIATMIISSLIRRSRPLNSTKPGDHNSGRYQELVRILQDPAGGKLITEFQNRTASDPTILSAKERVYLLRVAKEWTKWLGLPPTELPNPAESTQETDAVVAPDATFPTVTVSPTPTPTRSGAPVHVPAILTPVHPLSIVQQVDEILQEKLAEQPTLDKVIKLAEDPREGVVVWVNMIKHVGIDSVTDPDAREIIRSAVIEWERRNENKQS